MKALLDTRTFLWWNLDSPQLSSTARDFIANGENEICLSAVSAWEIALKYVKGRLHLPEAPHLYVPNRMAHYGFVGLSIHLSHTVRIATLPDIHNAPFDRLLVAQCISEELPILSGDPFIAQYPISTIWQ